MESKWARMDEEMTEQLEKAARWENREACYPSNEGQQDI